MDWLNYHHLHYFWVVAREGSIARATEQLKLAQPTISGQIRALERSLGEKLFNRVGRNLVLTDMGNMVFGYANEIFSLGGQLLDAIKNGPTGRSIRLAVGVVDTLPVTIATRLLHPALRQEHPVRLVCRRGGLERLLADLSVHGLDLILADSPITPTVKVKAFNHPLGDCGVIFLATPQLRARLATGFPASLHGAPMLLPSAGTALRRSLDIWFESRDIRPEIVGEFDDASLVGAFGKQGLGVFAAPTVLADVIQRDMGVVPVGQVDEIRERFFAISVERRLKHPAVVAISTAARTDLFRH